MRLIDANVLIEHLARCIEAEKGLLRAVCVAIKCFVEQMPTVDAVEVVRCKDCDNTCPGSNGLVCTAWGARTDPDGWCYKAERKGNG